MPANCFPCYPFAHPFEEEVTKHLATSLDENFLLIHNVIRPNKKPRSLLPKEIDLCILSRYCTALFVEIKNYRNPNIDDMSILGKRPNPIQEMKEYGQRFRSHIRKGGEPGFATIPVVILRKKNSNKIKPKWRSNCFEPMEFVDWLKQRIQDWHNKNSVMLRDSDLTRIREKYLCCVDVKPFGGFNKLDFDLLRKSREYATRSKDEEFKKVVLNPLYYKFRCMAYEIRSFLTQKGTTVFQTVMPQEQTMPQPIYWVAFTLRDVPNFLTDPQVAFHVSTKDWYESGKSYGDHFSSKLAFFESSQWMRKFLHRFRDEPTSFIRLIRENLADRGYRLVASRDPNDLFVNTPVSSPELQKTFEELARKVLDDGFKLRGISFERPFYCCDNKTLGSKVELMKTLMPEFDILLDFLRKILPEYFKEVSETSYK